MKRIFIFSLAFLLTFAVSLPAKVKVNPGVYTNTALGGDFDFKFWKEMFKGGYPGKPGNVLQALGEGFIFNQAKLVNVVPWAAPAPGSSDINVYAYKSTYGGGMLTLNPSGPWCDAGTLKATSMSITNYSSQDPPLTGILKFHLVITGTFDNAPDYNFIVHAQYEGQPEVKYDPYTGLPAFQRGMDADVAIEITGPAAAPSKKKGKKAASFIEGDF